MTGHDDLEFRWPRVLARGVLYGILAVMLYVLSFGPSVYVCAGVSDRNRPFYLPLMLLAKKTGMAPALGAYMHWWLDLPGRPAPPGWKLPTPWPGNKAKT